MKYNLCIWLCVIDDSLSLPLINSEAPVIHAMSSLALFSWPTPPASILTLESCRTVIPTASEHGVCKIPSQGVLVLTIYLWSQDKSWAFSTVDTMMGPQCRGMRAADLSLTGAIAVIPGVLWLLTCFRDLQLQRSHSLLFFKK